MNVCVAWTDIFMHTKVERIMLAPHESYSISSMAALREPTSAKLNITKSQAEIVLGSFVAKGWLLKSKWVNHSSFMYIQLTVDGRKGRYSLSTRSILELLPYLKSTYPEEILECTICLDVRPLLCTFTLFCIKISSRFLDNDSWSRLFYSQLQDPNALPLLQHIPSKA